jgi:hypothetical protein
MSAFRLYYENNYWSSGVAKWADDCFAYRFSLRYACGALHELQRWMIAVTILGLLLFVVNLGIFIKMKRTNRQWMSDKNRFNCRMILTTIIGKPSFSCHHIGCIRVCSNEMSMNIVG